MSSHTPKVDAGTKLIFIISLVFILLTVYVLISNLLNTYARNSTKGEIDATSYVGSASNNLKPVGFSATSDTVAVAKPTAARSGKDVYDAVCATCHATGVVGSPKMGDKAAWEARVATGIDAMMATAINGKGAMPARAGQNVGDEELKAAIAYMTKESGFDLGISTAAAAPVPVVAEQAQAVAEPVVEAVAEPVVATVPAVGASTDGAALYVAKGCGACHGADANSPIMPLYPKIAGQNTVYVTTQMTDIKNGVRSNGQSAAMKGIMASVSDAEIATIAEYLSGL